MVKALRSCTCVESIVVGGKFEEFLPTLRYVQQEYCTRVTRVRTLASVRDKFYRGTVIYVESTGDRVLWS